jgi:hypothetical protein
MLRRGFAPPGQPAPSGNGASAVLIPHRARRPEVLALLGSRTGPAALVRPDAAYRGAGPVCPPCSTPATSTLIQPDPPGGLACRRPEPRSPSRLERRSGQGPDGGLVAHTQSGSWGLPPGLADWPELRGNPQLGLSSPCRPPRPQLSARADHPQWPAGSHESPAPAPAAAPDRSPPPAPCSAGWPAAPPPPGA